jgi:Tfp pilus assembly protein PilE
MLTRHPAKPMDPMPDRRSMPSTASRGLVGRLRFHSRRGMTLAEAMMATFVFTLGMLGVYMMLVKSYQLVNLARHRDNARAVLLTYADQFLRLQTTDSNGNLIFFFQNASAPTSFGLSWTDSNNNTVSNTTNTADTTGLPITLGDTGSTAIPANVFRTCLPINMATGTTQSAPTLAAAGYMLQGTFSITYNVNGRTISQSITVARSFQ